jgi:molecular chaperone GrpE
VETVLPAQAPTAEAAEAVLPAQALTPEAVEAVLNDFRGWLSALPVGVPLPVAEEDDGPDLHTLIGQFVALRHEVNLQTKATRAQQEQAGATLQQLTQALESLRRAEFVAREARQATEEELLRPLLKTLVDLYDALALASREVQRMQDSLASLLERMEEAKDSASEPQPTQLPAMPSPSWWQRILGAGPVDVTAWTAEIARLRDDLVEERRLRAEQSNQTCVAAERVRQAVGSLVAGYGMSLQRVERAIAQHGLEQILSVGESFDPEQMEVVEAVTGSGRPSGEVLQEVRRGYLWNDRVFRYAQVRVAKG